jgi:hypothetical protein
MVSFAFLAASQFGWVRASNFRGFDEWLILSLLSEGIVSFPYANRPLNLIWTVPAPLLSPDGLGGFLFLHAAYLALAALLTSLTLTRLWPRHALLGWLAGALSLVWAPSDPARLCSVQMILYSGAALGCAVATWLFVDSCLRGSRAGLLLAAAAAVIPLLSAEAALGALAVGPLLILSSETATREVRRVRVWSCAWMAFLALGALRVAWPMVLGRTDVSYQAQLGTPSASGPGFVGRMAAQYSGHLWPLVAGLPRIDHPATALALAGFALGFAAVAHRAADLRARPLAMLAGTGLVWAGLAYAPFVISPHVVRPERTQILAAPGIGLFLAAVVMLIAGSGRWRPAVAAVLGALVVAQGTDRTLTLQKYWDRESFYRRQRDVLRQIAAAAPDFRPDTLVILLGGADVFRLDLGFRHAVKYLYGGRAVGHAPDATPYLYETRFDAMGIVHEPWPILRGPWHEFAARYRYDQAVVFVADDAGVVSLAGEWPGRLPPLPPGARYAPLSRVRRDGSPPARPLLR